MPIAIAYDVAFVSCSLRLLSRVNYFTTAPGFFLAVPAARARQLACTVRYTSSVTISALASRPATRTVATDTGRVNRRGPALPGLR